jgi:hypothetical protein
MNQPFDQFPSGQALLLAALALPGLQAHAESRPDTSRISVDYLHYQDWQPALERVGVRSPALHLLLPIAGDWSLEAGLVSDHVSGASPRYHTAVSGASHMADQRLGSDLRLTRYLGNASVSAGTAYSGENDYHSRAYSLAASVATEDHNSSASIAFGVSNDRIDPVNLAVLNERRHSTEWLLGVEQVMSERDIVKLDLTHSRGRGYFSDPYKYVDNRPRERDQNSVQLRWNHHAERDDGVLRLSYRYYRDSYRIDAHTLGADYERPLAGGWSLTPSLRLYTQGAADFYFDPVYDRVFGKPFPPGYRFGSDELTSADQRLAAFGAITVGLRVEKQFDQGWAVHAKLERYRQQSNWRQFGDGSPGLARFDARIWQMGLSKQW